MSQPQEPENDKLAQARLNLARQVHETFRAIRYSLEGIGASPETVGKLAEADMAVLRELLPEGMTPGEL